MRSLKLLYYILDKKKHDGIDRVFKVNIKYDS